jgi:hypothetical protein
MFFFIPDALVATQPPRELNSIESGSCPTQTPFSCNYTKKILLNEVKITGFVQEGYNLTCLSKSSPMMPASAHMVIFS